jgi:transcriptional regulator with XRE-family HTH domain
MTSTEAAARYGIAVTTWSLWENDKRTPPPERQAAILAALSVPASTGASGDYQRGALWALAAMHETLGRLYRELAQPAPADTTLPVADLAELESLTQEPSLLESAPRARAKRAK